MSASATLSPPARSESSTGVNKKGTSRAFPSKQPPPRPDSSAGAARPATSDGGARGGGGGGERPVAAAAALAPAPTTEPLSMRDRAEAELVETEQSYVRDVLTLIEVFLLPLRQWVREQEDERRDAGGAGPSASSSSSSASARDGAGEDGDDDGDAGLPMGGHSGILAVFSNIEQLIEVNRKFLEDLGSGTAGRPSEVLGRMAPFFKMYNLYINTFDTARSKLQDYMKSSAPLRAFIRACELQPRCRSLTLPSFLILPVQRIPRYKLLLEEMLKHTDQGANPADYAALSTAIAEVGKVASTLNEDVAMHESRQRVIEFTEAFGIDLLTPSRMHVRDAALHRISRKGKKPCFFVLFNDMLVYGTEGRVRGGKRTYRLRGRIPLHNCAVVDITGTSDILIMELDGKAFTMRCPDDPAKAVWFRDLSDYIAACHSRPPRDTTPASSSTNAGGVPGAAGTGAAAGGLSGAGATGGGSGASDPKDPSPPITPRGGLRKGFSVRNSATSGNGSNGSGPGAGPTGHGRSISFYSLAGRKAEYRIFNLSEETMQLARSAGVIPYEDLLNSAMQNATGGENGGIMRPRPPQVPRAPLPPPETPPPQGGSAAGRQPQPQSRRPARTQGSWHSAAPAVYARGSFDATDVSNTMSSPSGERPALQGRLIVITLDKQEGGAGIVLEAARNADGVAVKEFREDSLGERAGVRPADIITHVNDTAVFSVKDATKEMAKVATGAAYRLVIRRRSTSLLPRTARTGSSPDRPLPRQANASPPPLRGLISKVRSRRDVADKSTPSVSTSQRPSMDENDLTGRDSVGARIVVPAPRSTSPQSPKRKGTLSPKSLVSRVTGGLASRSRPSDTASFTDTPMGSMGGAVRLPAMCTASEVRNGQTSFISSGNAATSSAREQPPSAVNVGERNDRPPRPGQPAKRLSAQEVTVRSASGSEASDSSDRRAPRPAGPVPRPVTRGSGQGQAQQFGTQAQDNHQLQQQWARHATGSQQHRHSQYGDGGGEDASDEEFDDEDEGTTTRQQGWTSVLDELTNQYYYFNALTGESRWDDPTVQSAQSTPWKEYMDDASGCCFYSNVQTGETTWERPPDFVPAVDETSLTGMEIPDTTTHVSTPSLHISTTPSLQTQTSFSRADSDGSKPNKPPRRSPTAADALTLALDDMRALTDSQLTDIGIDPRRRELYLPDNEFCDIFGMSKKEFSHLPKWRQDQQKKAHSLF